MSTYAHYHSSRGVYPGHPLSMLPAMDSVEDQIQDILFIESWQNSILAPTTPARQGLMKRLLKRMKESALGGFRKRKKRIGVQFEVSRFSHGCQLEACAVGTGSENGGTWRLYRGVLVTRRIEGAGTVVPPFESEVHKARPSPQYRRKQSERLQNNPKEALLRRASTKTESFDHSEKKPVPISVVLTLSFRAGWMFFLERGTTRRPGSLKGHHTHADTDRIDSWAPLGTWHLLSLRTLIYVLAPPRIDASFKLASLILLP
ncbi:hypothetical protein K438DRAFT_1769635 [Mycena galopus ATCC 62051]|nr:hypothetical protein K438DRAFT_1769635 [Mycena galopus ATCC 62051]